MRSGNLPVATFWRWPGLGAPSIDLVATFLAAELHVQRLLWTRQIEKSSDQTQPLLSLDLS